jgi:hypothetical protein
LSIAEQVSIAECPTDNTTEMTAHRRSKCNRHFSLGRFPPLDRIDYIDHAVVLAERERVRPVRPTLEEIQHYLVGAPRGLDRPGAALRDLRNA